MSLRLVHFASRLLLGVVLAGLLAANIWFLWKPRAEDVSGDVLIHLIFARNWINGHPNEFNLGEKSRALTSISWNLLLAEGGKWSGLGQKTQGFLDFARFSAGITLFGALGIGWRILRKTGATRESAGWALAITLASPITFYWCAANPMETALAILLVLAMVRLVLPSGPSPGKAWLLALNGFLLLTTRPELALLSGLAVLSVLFENRARPYRQFVGFLLHFTAAWLLLLAASWLIARTFDLPLLPTAFSARRMMINSRDAIVLPLLQLHFSKDAWLLAGVFAPFGWGMIRFWQRNSAMRSVCLFVVAALGYGVLFFSFYFCTTWQGRYLLPLLVPLWLLGTAGLLEKFNVWLRTGLTVYLLAVNLLLLRPLAAFANAPATRAAIERHYLQPGPEVKTILVQEIQGAWFYPQIRFLCTEGLIQLETESARQRGLSVYDFVLETRPDWIGTGRYPLADPDRWEQIVAQAAQTRSDFQCRSLRGIYQGEMAGCGPVFRLESAESAKSSR